MFVKLRAYLIFFATFILLADLAFLFQPPPQAEASNSQISILYKSADATTNKIFQLNAREVLLTGSKIQIRIKSLKAGNYKLVLEFAGKEKSTLVEEVKVDGNTAVHIPSSSKWLTLSNNSGNYKLILWNNTNNRVVMAFPFAVLPSSNKDKLAKDNSSKGLPIKLSDFHAISKASSVRLGKYLNLGKRIYSRPVSFTTRGVGAKIYRDIAPAVPYIMSYDKNDEQLGTGSGLIISKQGDIITNHHVIEGSAFLVVYIKPHTGDIRDEKVIESHMYLAKLIKSNRTKDLAHIRIITPPNNLILAELGENKEILIGGDVHAIGHPDAQPWVYTSGTIGQVWPDYKWEKEHEATVIQTQTPINPGNSGGPLITDDGVVIGINTFMLPSLQNTNFAVSAGDIKEFMSENTPLPPAESQKQAKTDNETNNEKLKLISKLDLDGNGVSDGLVYDQNGNGIGDILITNPQEDNNKKNFRYFLDKDEDGFWDTEIVEKENVRIYLFDTNKDGTVDVVGYDNDKDGTIDKYQKMTG